MKRMFLIGRSEAGKTSLSQVLNGEQLHYVKTQYTNVSDKVIDTPGEYTESKKLAEALSCFSYESDVVAVVQAADEPFSLFGPSIRSGITRPIIGIITKTDSPNANVPMVMRWMEEIGCDRIFCINNKTGEGAEELTEYLNEDLPKLSMDEAIAKQRRGLREYD